MSLLAMSAFRPLKLQFMAHKFYIRFLNKGVPVEFSDALTRQVVKLSPLIINKPSSRPSQTISIVFDDDEEGLAHDSLHKLFNAGNFEIEINQTDFEGGSVCRRTMLLQCDINTIEYTALDFSSCNCGVQIVAEISFSNYTFDTINKLTS